MKEMILSKSSEVKFLIEGNPYMNCVFLWYKDASGRVQVEDVVMNGNRLNFLVFLTLYAPNFFVKLDAVASCRGSLSPRIINCQSSDFDFLINQSPVQVSDRGVCGCEK
jgi:hypothetical protein